MHLKRGDTFAFYVALQDAEGVPTVTDVTTLKSQVRNNLGQLIAILDISVTDTPGVFLVQKLDTTNWPLGELVYDLKYMPGEIITSTDTGTIYVERDVTRNE